MSQETVTINKDLYDIMRCLTVALMDKYCPNGEFILTKEHRKSLVDRFQINVQTEIMDNLDARYWIDNLGKEKRYV